MKEDIKNVIDISKPILEKAKLLACKTKRNIEFFIINLGGSMMKK